MKVKGILEFFSDFFQRNKKLCIFFFIFFGLLFSAKVVGMVKEKTEIKSPIVTIKATAQKKYLCGETFRPEDFKVTATHENGRTSVLKKDSYTLSVTTTNVVGTKTMVTIALKDDPDITCKVEAKTIRHKVVEWNIGYPNVEDVTATFYDTGELHFSGTGEFMTFDEAQIPWKNYEDNEGISSITFSDTVEPTILDNYFSGLEQITYVGKIPSTVRSMRSTFANCIYLTKTADWSGCENLTDITSCYEGAKSIKETIAIPSSVVRADYTFKDCTALQYPVDISNAVSLDSCVAMYFNCRCLVEANIATNVTDAESMYQNCINLKTVPEFGPKILYIDNMFNGCTSLRDGGTIPASVASISNLFYGCLYLEGEITMDCNATTYDGAFGETCRMTEVNLVGASNYLYEYAVTCNYFNVFVNGYEPTVNQTVKYVDESEEDY